MPVFPKINRGEIVYRHTKKMLCMKWKDNRDVHMLTSIHEAVMVDTDKTDHAGQVVRKPACVVEYNKKMRIIDKADMLVSSVECVRKSSRWYMKLFYHMIDLSVLNAYYLYRMKTGKKLPLLDFSKAVIRQMVNKFHVGPTTAAAAAGQAGRHCVLRLTGRHFHVPLQATEKVEKPCRRCHVCANTTKRPKKVQLTPYKCKQCDIALCVYPCNEEYHTQQLY